ncbi:ATP-binding cassette domain-containing protein, partial [Clostridium perfringens]
GEVLIDGKSTKDRNIRETLAYIPETPDLYNLLTVWEHFKFIALAYNIKDWTSKAEDLMSVFNLSNKKDALAKDLSKGMKQKVSIIMALIHNPNILLIDEPFVGLDPNGIKEFREMLAKIKELGKTILV